MVKTKSNGGGSSSSGTSRIKRLQAIGTLPYRHIPWPVKMADTCPPGSAEWNEIGRICGYVSVGLWHDLDPIRHACRLIADSQRSIGLAIVVSPWSYAKGSNGGWGQAAGNEISFLNSQCAAYRAAMAEHGVKEPVVIVDIEKLDGDTEERAMKYSIAYGIMRHYFEPSAMPLYRHNTSAWTAASSWYADDTGQEAMDIVGKGASCVEL